MICKNCGAQIDDNSVECSFCGAILKDISEDEVTKVIDTAAVNTADDVVTERMPGVEPADETDALFDENERKRMMQLNRLKAEKQQQLDEIEKRRNEKKKKQKRNRLIAIVIIVLALGGIGGGVYYLSQYQSDAELIVEKDEATATPLPTVEPEETDAPETEETETPTAAPEVGAGSVSAASSGAGSASGSTSGSAGTTAQSSASGSSGTSKAQASSSSTGNHSASGSGAAGSTSSGSGSAAQSSTASNTPAAAKDYSGIAVGADGYVFSDSASRLLTEADLEGKSADELRIARNEIYARHGRKFKDASLQNYFNSCAWYSINGSYNYSNDAANLNSIEQANTKFILQYEKSHK